MIWSCFMLEPTGRARRSLRRFDDANDTCTAHPGWGHDASTPIEDCELTFKDDGTYTVLNEVPHDDPRWPTQCVCGYKFSDADIWQVSGERVWRAEDGREYTIHPNHPDRAPAGAMWDCVWHHDIPDWCGPDGRSLTVMLPDGYTWLIDGPSRSGGKWTRTGDVPNITVSPSILSPSYHGFLQNGILTEDLEGRGYGDVS